MIKYLVLLINLIGLFVYQLFMQSGVTVQQTAPASIQAGSTFTVEVTINKAAASGFAKYQANLPQGFTATAVDKAGATVLASGNAIKFIWASLPGDATMKLSYTVTVDASVTGNQSIDGTFLYVDNNTKVPVPANVLNIAVGGGIVAVPTATTNTNTALPPDTTNHGQMAQVTPPNPNPVPTPTVTPQPQGSGGGNPNPQSGPMNPAVGGVYATRDVSSGSVAPGGPLTVTVTVHKGALAGFAKLEEKLPDGFTASEDATGKGKGSASFTFVEGKMKMVWLSLPSDSVFSVSYILTAGGNSSGSQLVTGKFQFIYNGAATPYQIAGTSFVVSGAGIVQVPTNTVVPNPTNTVTPNPTNTVTPEPIKTTPIVQHGSKGVMYNVQIMALHNALSDYVGYFKRTNNISEAITPRMEEGFTKYIVGKFGVYKDARDHREEVKAKNVVAPFVVAYNNGGRISVQEALMITKQSWVQ